jgi:hypothetical protein
MLTTGRAPFFQSLLAVFLLLGCSTLWAVDTDGDGVADTPMPSQLSVGGIHACVLDDNGVHCWGYNNAGQTSVPVLANPTAVSAGDSHTCALDDAGVHCWGSNNSGQTTVPALSNPTAVSAGGTHTCAIDDSGLQCWGNNSNGQTTVPPLVHPTQVSTGMFSTCALDDNGVQCWGNNFQSQTVPSLTNPVAVSMGGYHACALDDTGVHCWGAGTTNTGSGVEYGQSMVPALSHPIAVSAGFEHTCAVDDNGVHCWGNNDGGQTTVPVLMNPVAVSTSGQNSPANNATCARDDMGVHCWGGVDKINSDIPSSLAFTRQADNCPHTANPDQADGDGDHLGNACDPLPADGENLNIFNGNTKTDKTGASVVFAGDFNGDGFGDYVVGMPGYDVPPSPPIKAIKNAGKVEIISGNDGSPLYSQDGITVNGALGSAVAGNADINKDGLADVVVGAPLGDAQDGRKAIGVVYIIYGKASGTPLVDSLNNDIFAAKAMFGASLALGDVDNDGQADVVVGAPYATNTQVAKPLKQAGCVAVYSGAALHSMPIMGDCGKVAKAHAGAAVAAGNFDNLPGAEVVVGAPNDRDESGKNTGSTVIYGFGQPFSLSTQYGNFAKDGFGSALAVGTHYADNVVLIGAPGADNNKVKDAGAIYRLSSSDQLSLMRIGSEAGAKLGSAVALTDVNGDGTTDFIIGAPKGDSPTIPKITKDTGSVLVLNGINGSTLSTQYGTAKGDAFGTSISAGDINADGKADILIGIPGKDVTVTIDGKAKVQKNAGGVTILNATEL